MKLLRFDFKQDWIFHLFVFGYLLLILRMSYALWIGDGINIFISYSSALTAEELLVDANKIYWSKTCFLFLTLLLFTLNFDYRFAAGIAASFWSISLILMFELSPILLFVLFLSVISNVCEKSISYFYPCSKPTMSTWLPIPIRPLYILV